MSLSPVQSDSVPSERVSNGFRFTRTDAGLTIQDRAGQSRWHRLLILLVFGIALVSALPYCIQLAREVASVHGRDVKTLAVAGFVLAVIGAVVLAWARRAFGGHQILVLTHDRITITDVDFGVAWRTRSFPAQDVLRVERITMGDADCGDTYSVRFITAARRLTIFRGNTLQAVDDAIGAINSFLARV